MDGFIIFAFILFFIIIPILGNSGKKKSKHKSRSKKNSRSSRNQSGHSNAHSRSHKNMHSRDNAKVFPDTHAGRVQAREAKDRRSRAEMKRGVLGAKNRGVIRAANKGRDDWGVRGDRGLGNSRNFFTLILLAILAYVLVATFAPELLHSVRL